jgi:hypothetical protein
VVLNLLVNAQQALAAVAGAGAARVRVSTGVEARRDNREPRVWLRVADSGPGVPPALHETIFEPFFTTKPEGVGTGLGLAVSRTLAREHGGELGWKISSGGRTLPPEPADQRHVPKVSPSRGPWARAADGVPAPAACWSSTTNCPRLPTLMRAMLEAPASRWPPPSPARWRWSCWRRHASTPSCPTCACPTMDGAARPVARGGRATRRWRGACCFVTGDTLERRCGRTPSCRRWCARGSPRGPSIRSDLLAEPGLKESVVPWSAREGWTTAAGLGQLIWPDAQTPPDAAALWRVQTLSQLAETAHGRQVDLAASYQLLWPQRQVVRFPWLPGADVVGEGAARPGRSLQAALDERYAGPCSAPAHPCATRRSRPTGAACRAAAKAR